MTNGDKIRSMTDEELAKELGWIEQDAYLFGAGLRKHMNFYPDGYVAMIEWLKSEAE